MIDPMDTTSTRRGKPLRKYKTKVRGGKADRFIDLTKSQRAGKPCFVCGEEATGYVAVGPWDAPCCVGHDLKNLRIHADVRIDGKVRFRVVKPDPSVPVQATADAQPQA